MKRHQLFANYTNESVQHFIPEEEHLLPDVLALRVLDPDALTLKDLENSDAMTSNERTPGRMVDVGHKCTQYE